MMATWNTYTKIEDKHELFWRYKDIDQEQVEVQSGKTCETPKARILDKKSIKNELEKIGDKGYVKTHGSLELPDEFLAFLDSILKENDFYDLFNSINVVKIKKKLAKNIKGKTALYCRSNILECLKLGSFWPDCYLPGDYKKSLQQFKQSTYNIFDFTNIKEEWKGNSVSLSFKLNRKGYQVNFTHEGKYHAEEFYNIILESITDNCPQFTVIFDEEITLITEKLKTYLIDNSLIDEEDSDFLGNEEPEDSLPPFFQAIWEDDLKSVKKLIKQGVKLNKGVDEMDDQIYEEIYDFFSDHTNFRNFAWRPLFFVNSPAMLDLLIESGAELDYSANSRYIFYFLDRPEILKAALKHTPLDILNKEGMGLLHAAQKIEACQTLIDHGFDINQKDKSGKTALFYAIKQNIKKFRCLLKLSPALNIADKQGKQLIHYAIESKKITVIKALIKAGIDLNVKDGRSRSSYYYADQIDHQKIFDYLISVGLADDDMHRLKRIYQDTKEGNLENLKNENVTADDLKQVFEDDIKLVHLAIFKGHIEILNYFLEIGFSLKQTNSKGESLLLQAIHYMCRETYSNCPLEMIEKLIDLDIPLDNKILDKISDAHYYDEFYRLKILTRILQAKANIEDAQRALFSCIDHKDIESLMLLINKGAKLNVTSQYGGRLLSSLLSTASYWIEGRVVIESILDKNYPVKLDDIFGAVGIEDPKILTRILEKVDPDLNNLEKVDGIEVPRLLINAAYYNHIENAKILLEFGFPVNGQVKDKETALHNAVQEGKSIEMIKLLLSYGADTSLKDKSGNTALDYADTYKKDRELKQTLTWQEFIQSIP